MYHEKKCNCGVNYTKFVKLFIYFYDINQMAIFYIQCVVRQSKLKGKTDVSDNRYLTMIGNPLN
jgi:hypothetical protein